MAVISSSTSPLPGAVTHPSPSVGGDGRGRVGMGGGKGGMRLVEDMMYSLSM